MYVLRTPNCRKRDLEKRWALPDRVFFACGACHILAYAFLERHGTPAMRALWIRPAAGHTGNHIFVADGATVFDFHGYSGRARFLDHYWRRARFHHAGWDATLVALPPEILVAGPASRAIDGLWLRGPDQYFADALPRARAFVARFPSPAERFAQSALRHWPCSVT